MVGRRGGAIGATTPHSWASKEHVEGKHSIRLEVTDLYNLAAYRAPMQDGIRDLKARTREFAIRIVNVYRSLSHATDAQVLGKQLLRAGIGVGANYRAAQRARSKAEFVAKMGIVIEEADETLFWLDLLVATDLLPEAKLAPLMKEADELIAIFVSSRITAKR